MVSLQYKLCILVALEVSFIFRQTLGYEDEKQLEKTGKISLSQLCSLTKLELFIIFPHDDLDRVLFGKVQCKAAFGDKKFLSVFAFHLQKKEQNQNNKQQMNKLTSRVF